MTIPKQYEQDLEYKCEAAMIALLKEDRTLASLDIFHHDEDTDEALSKIKLKVMATEQGEYNYNTGVYNVAVEIEISGNAKVKGQKAGDIAAVFGKVKRLVDIETSVLVEKFNAYGAGITVGNVLRNVPNQREQGSLVRRRSITRTLICGENAE